MAEYAPGMRVLIRDEEWMVKKIETNAMGNKALYCVGVSPLIKNRESIFLDDLENIIPMNPAEIVLVPDDSSRFKKTKLYIESQWRQKIPTDTNLHIGYDAVMDTMDFQLDPAKIALQRPRQRILIADTVGLGKTLEAGILMSELIARGKGKRILVVTVKSMMTQFQKEMWNRFTIPLVRLDSNRIQKIRAKLPTNYNPFYYYDKAIVSIDTLKRDVEYRTHLENAYWDIIVIDEAHNVAERGDHQAQRARLAKLLAERSDTLIMLSATPHDGRAKSFASLMRMLDATTIPNEDEYTKEDIKGLCIRRFKKDVKDQLSSSYKERNMVISRCKASKQEEYVYDIFADMHLEMDEGKTRGSGQLFKTSLEKALFSSPAACLKSIDERLKKLMKKYPDGQMHDIIALRELRDAITKVGAEEFSRYQKLLATLKSAEYGWSKNDTKDRLVIFTERIETMKYLAAHLREDLGMNDEQVVEISGGDSDSEQQKKVEDFGRDESKMRVLVASDVASEGLNLHYLCHRLIHFDIPWSLMVFQQRNGRVDRYGQEQQPDVRFLITESDNEKINGDIRVVEILINKENKARDNIGDPALIMGKFNVEEEEEMTASAIESGAGAAAFEESLDATEDEFDAFAMFMGEEDSEEQVEVRTVEDKTLYKDKDYLYEAVSFFNLTEHIPVEKLNAVSGVKIRVEEDSVLAKRLAALLPEEVQPNGGYLQLSDDKKFCMHEMKLSMQNTMEENAWPNTQYLWKLHPIFNWANDRASLLYKRNEAPIIGVDALERDKTIFVVSGSIPNQKSTPLVDEMFGVVYENGAFKGILAMEEVMNTSKLRKEDLPNRNVITDQDIRKATMLLPNVIDQAKLYMAKNAASYQETMGCKLDEELGKLAGLEERHNEQLSLFSEGSQKDARRRYVDKLFSEFENWVTETLTIQADNPYIRIVAILAGVE